MYSLHSCLASLSWIHVVVIITCIGTINFLESCLYRCLQFLLFYASICMMQYVPVLGILLDLVGQLLWCWCTITIIYYYPNCFRQGSTACVIGYGISLSQSTQVWRFLPGHTKLEFSRSMELCKSKAVETDWHPFKSYIHLEVWSKLIYSCVGFLIQREDGPFLSGVACR